MFTGLFQPMHLLIILIIVLIVFGPGKLPDLGKSLGKAIRDFKIALDEDTDKSKSDDQKKIEGPKA